MLKIQALYLVIFPLCCFSTVILRQTINTQNEEPTCIATSSRYLLVGTNGGNVLVYSSQQSINSSYQKKIKLHSNRITNMIFTDGEQLLISGGYDGYIKITNPDSFTIIYRYKVKENILYLTLFPDQRYLACLGDQGYISIYDLQGNNISKIQSVREYNGGWPPQGNQVLQFSKQGWFLFSLDNNKIIMWSSGAINSIKYINSFSNGYKYIQLSPNNLHLAVSVQNGSNEYQIVLYQIDQQNGELHEYRKIGSHKQEINCLQYSKNGKFLISTSVNTELKVWDVQNSYSLVDSIKAHSQSLLMALFSYDQNNIYTISLENTIKIWEINYSSSSSSSLSSPQLPYLCEQNSISFQSRESYYNNNKCIKITKIAQLQRPTDVDGSDEIMLTIQNYDYEEDQVSIGILKFDENHNEYDINVQMPCSLDDEIKIKVTEWDVCDNDYAVQYIPCSGSGVSILDFQIIPENTVITQTLCNSISDGSGHCAETGASSDSEVDLGISYQYCKTFEEGTEQCVEVSQGENESLVQITYEIVSENNCQLKYSSNQCYIGSFGPQYRGEPCDIDFSSGEIIKEFLFIELIIIFITFL